MKKKLHTVKIGSNGPAPKEREYDTVWRAKWTCDGAKTLEEAAVMLEEAAAELRKMAVDGLGLRDEIADDYGFVVTTDPKLAKKYGMSEVEYEDDGDDGEPEVAETSS